MWEYASKTSEDLLGRLAVLPLVQEARALDACPRLVTKLNSAGDHESAKLVQQIVEEEVDHVARGLKWFERICKMEERDPIKTFHAKVREYIPAPLPGPFNEMARDLANMSKDYYLPVSRGYSQSMRAKKTQTTRKQQKQPA